MSLKKNSKVHLIITPFTLKCVKTGIFFPLRSLFNMRSVRGKIRDIRIRDVQKIDLLIQQQLVMGRN